MRVFSMATGLGQLQQEKTHRGDASSIGGTGRSVQCSALSKRCPPDWFWGFMWVMFLCCVPLGGCPSPPAGHGRLSVS